jgi:organic radical activating enzyme
MTMVIGDLKNPGRINILKYSIADGPHATIEPNRTCNIRCQHCYNLDRDGIKPFEAVKAEIDTAARKRNLQVITILGGEPTLHPKLDQIISYIKSKNILCHVLTNGLRLLDDPEGRYMDGLIRAGMDKILVHIDSGQSHIHPDVEEARRTLCSKLEKRKIPFSLAITITNEDQGALAELVKRYSKYRYFDGILAVVARDPLPPKIQKVELSDEYRSLTQNLKIEPSSYVPSNLSDKEVTWLVYTYFINPLTGETFPISPLFDRLYRRAHKLASGRHAFVISPKPSFYEMVSAGVCLADAVVHPRKWPAFRRFLRSSSLLRAGRFHYIAIQMPPEYDDQLHKLRFCYGCPDATIRNSMLTPVCIADLINPLNRNQGHRDINKDWYREVYSEMGELGHF